MIEMKTVASLTVFGLALSGCASISKRTIETTIEIPAPRQAVWETLTDVKGHENWNPFIVKMEGDLIEGQRLRNTMAPNLGETIVFKPKILKVEDARELRWIGRVLMPGIFDGEHYFILEDTEKGTKLTHGEHFSGIAVLFTNVGKFENNLEQLNHALLKQTLSVQSLRAE